MASSVLLNNVERQLPSLEIHDTFNIRIIVFEGCRTLGLFPKHSSSTSYYFHVTLYLPNKLDFLILAL